MLPSNQDRVNRVAAVLRLYATGDCPREGLTDLLADARHWCDRNCEDYSQLDRIAYQHYLAELADDKGGLK